MSEALNLDVLTEWQRGVLSRIQPNWEEEMYSSWRAVKSLRTAGLIHATPEQLAIERSMSRILDDGEYYYLNMTPRGWTFFGDIPMVQVAPAVDLLRHGGTAEAADEVMAAQISDNLDYLKMVMRNVDLFGPIDDFGHCSAGEARWEIIQQALELHAASKYEAAILLIATQADGIVEDVTQFIRRRRGDECQKGSSLFGGNMPILKFPDRDTLFGDREQMKRVLARFVESMEDSGIPGSLSRHAAMHGRSLDYGTRVNSAKYLFLLAGVIDWALPRFREENENIETDAYAEFEGTDEFDDEGYPRDARGYEEARNALCSWVAATVCGSSMEDALGRKNIRREIDKTVMVRREDHGGYWFVVLQLPASGLYLGAASVGRKTIPEHGQWSYQGFEEPAEFNPEKPPLGWYDEADASQPQPYIPS